MKKFKAGDTVKVVAFGYNATDFFNNKVHNNLMGVYQFIYWSDMVFEISNLPVKFWKGDDFVKGCDCYPLALNGEEIGYVYENALVKV